MFNKKRVSKKDFDQSMLPSNRVEGFLDILRNKKSHLFNLGLTLLIFAIPFIVLLTLTNVEVYEVNLLLQNELISSKDASEEIFKIFNTSNISLIPALLILGVGISGALNVIKNMIFQESIFFFHDFKKGIKNNSKDVLLILFIIGVIYFIAQFVILEGYFLDDSLQLTLAISFSLVAFILSVILGLSMIFQSILYNLSFYGKLKNSFIFLVKYFLKTIGLLIGLLIPWLLIFIPSDIFYIVIWVFLFVIIMPIELLVLNSYYFSIFDIEINKDHYQEIYKKGLWNHDWY